jgi:hypothetical protein
MKEMVKVLNPRGKVETPAEFIVAPRLKDLNGKRIGIYWNGKPDGDYFWDTIEELIKQKYPSVTILRYNGPGDLGEAMASRLAKEIDTFLYGVGD